jgi:hypothetical protein
MTTSIEHMWMEDLVAAYASHLINGRMVRAEIIEAELLRRHHLLMDVVKATSTYQFNKEWAEQLHNQFMSVSRKDLRQTYDDMVLWRKHYREATSRRDTAYSNLRDALAQITWTEQKEPRDE